MDATGVAEAVERARHGDREGLTEIYQAFGRRVLGLCRHLLGSVEAAEDARGEVFARLGRALERYDAALPFDRWLMSVASHHCLDLLRRRRLEARLFVAESEAPESAGGGVESGPTPLAAVLAEEGRDRVRDALARLPDRYGCRWRCATTGSSATRRSRQSSV
jgi:RNA polymerase sigma factor (sigma-70 family)